MGKGASQHFGVFFVGTAGGVQGRQSPKLKLKLSDTGINCLIKFKIRPTLYKEFINS